MHSQAEVDRLHADYASTRDTKLGRFPRVPEVAARTGLSHDQVLEAMEVDAVDRILSIDAPSADGRHFDPWQEDPGLEGLEERADLAALVHALPERAQTVLKLRFVDQLTQAEIGRRVGVSQMGISRTLNRTLDRMRVLTGAPSSTGDSAF